MFINIVDINKRAIFLVLIIIFLALHIKIKKILATLRRFNPRCQFSNIIYCISKHCLGAEGRKCLGQPNPYGKYRKPLGKLCIDFITRPTTLTINFIRKNCKRLRSLLVAAHEPSERQVSMPRQTTSLRNWRARATNRRFNISRYRIGKCLVSVRSDAGKVNVNHWQYSWSGTPTLAVTAPLSLSVLYDNDFGLVIYSTGSVVTGKLFNGNFLRQIHSKF